MAPLEISVTTDSPLPTTCSHESPVVCVLVTQSCPTLCGPVDCSPPSISVHGILQARILEWVVIPTSRGSSWPRDRIEVSRIAGRFFTVWATSEAQSPIEFISLIALGCMVFFWTPPYLSLSRDSFVGSMPPVSNLRSWHQPLLPFPFYNTNSHVVSFSKFPWSSVWLKYQI